MTLSQPLRMSMTCQPSAAPPIELEHDQLRLVTVGELGRPSCVRAGPGRRTARLAEHGLGRSGSRRRSADRGRLEVGRQVGDGSPVDLDQSPSLVDVGLDAVAEDRDPVDALGEAEVMRATHVDVVLAELERRHLAGVQSENALVAAQVGPRDRARVSGTGSGQEAVETSDDPWCRGDRVDVDDSL